MANIKRKAKKVKNDIINKYDKLTEADKLLLNKMLDAIEEYLDKYDDLISKIFENSQEAINNSLEWFLDRIERGSN